MNINEIFKITYYKSNNKEELSLISMLTDVYGVIKILDFYSKDMLKEEKREINIFTTTMIVVILNFIYHEITSYVNINYKVESFNTISKNVRYAVHQFRKNNFIERDKILTDNMGISIDENKPMLDFFIYFKKSSSRKELLGTNIWDSYVIQNNFEDDMNLQSFLDSIMIFFRSTYSYLVENGIDDSKYEFEIKNNIDFKINKQPYSFVSLIRKSKIKNQNVIKRLLIAYSQLSIIETLFSSLINIKEDIIKYDYLLYFLNKIIAYVLDETYDNINSYIYNSKNSSESKILEEILNKFKNTDIEKNKKLRNNFHYLNQDIVFSNVNDMYEYFKINMDVIKEIKESIKNIINLKNQKFTFALYRLLEWTRYGYNE